MEDFRYYHDLPWISKSTIKLFDFCRRKFYYHYVKHYKEPVGSPAVKGTNMHLMFNLFFDLISRGELQKITIEVGVPVKETSLFRYFYNLLITNMPPEAGEVARYHTILLNFAEMQAELLTSLVEQYQDKTKALDAWIPFERELFSEDEENQLYGTLDVVYKVDDKYLLYDYKTGYTPIWALDYIKCSTCTTINPFVTAYCKGCGKLLKEPRVSTKWRKEIWFYGKLFSKKYDVPVEDLECGFMFFGDKHPYWKEIPYHKATINAIDRTVKLIRQVYSEDGPWDWDYIVYKCRHCAWHEDCRKEWELSLLEES